MKSLITLTMLLLLPMAIGCGGQKKTEEKANSGQNEVGKTGVSSTPITESPPAHKEKVNSDQNAVGKIGVTSTPITEPSPAHKEELRTWSAGQFSKEGRFERLDPNGRVVCLTTKDGRTIRVPYAKLSEADQEYARDVDRKRAAGPSVGTVSLSVVPGNEFFQKKKIPLPSITGGLWLREVPIGCPTWTAGLRNIDILYAIDDTPTKTFDDYIWTIKAMEVGKSYDFHVERLTQKGDSNTWEKLTFNVIALRQAEVAQTVKNSSFSDIETAKTEWKEWETTQSQIDQEKRPFELKADRLGMTLAMFKSKYHRVDHLDNPAQCVPTLIPILTIHICYIAAS